MWWKGQDVRIFELRSRVDQGVDGAQVVYKYAVVGAPKILVLETWLVVTTLLAAKVLREENKPQAPRGLPYFLCILLYS
jgi:hypothetical protein